MATLGGILSRDRPPRGNGLALDGNVTEAELRRVRLTGSALCFTLFAVLTILVKTAWEPLQQFDNDLGTWPESFTSTNHGAYLFWHYLGLATTTIPMVIATAVVAVALEAKKHRRAAIWTVGVMATHRGSDHAAQAAGRTGTPRLGRPDPGADELTRSRRATPASIVGAMGVAVVLTRMLVRRGRRTTPRRRFWPW